MAIKMVKRISVQVTQRKTVPSETSSSFTNQRFAFGNAGDNVQPGCCHPPEGPNAAKVLPHHPGLIPREGG